MYTHSLRPAIIALYIAISLIFVSPVSAQTPSTDERAALQAQIVQLLQQIQFLQELVAAQSNPSFEAPIYETNFPEVDFEAIYKVESNELVRIDSDYAPRAKHQELWQLFVDLVGESNSYIYIDEFRVFDDEDSPLGGFVELKPRLVGHPEEWVLAINEGGYALHDADVEDLYQDLLIHEYAHILLYRLSDFTETFEATYWTSADRRHINNLDGLALTEIEGELEEYYEDNKDRFVSDYATLNVDEDLAETFSVFVREDKPSSRQNSIVDRKIKSLYTESLLVEARNTIRKNLGIN